MGDGNSHLQNTFYHPSYVMSQLCVKVMVDDRSLSIAVLVHSISPHTLNVCPNVYPLLHDVKACLPTRLGRTDIDHVRIIMQSTYV